MIYLKDCPFCGGKADISIEDNGERYNLFGVYCKSCGCRRATLASESVSEGQKKTVYDVLEIINKAVDLWNNRVVEEKE